MACLILFLTSSFMPKMWSLYEVLSSFLKHLISVACNLFLYSACPLSMFRFRSCRRVPRQPGSAVDFLAKGDILFVPDGLQFRQCCCRLCKPGRYFRLGTLICDNCAQVLKNVLLVQFLPLTLMSMLMPSVWLVISLVFSTLISMQTAEEVLSRRSTREATVVFPPLFLLSPQFHRQNINKRLFCLQC